MQERGPIEAWSLSSFAHAVQFYLRACKSAALLKLEKLVPENFAPSYLRACKSAALLKPDTVTPAMNALSDLRACKSAALLKQRANAQPIRALWTSALARARPY